MNNIKFILLNWNLAQCTGLNSSLSIYTIFSNIPPVQIDELKTAYEALAF